ncbi:uncharacterized protein ACIBXB_019772 [Morphnus guianensis]
MAVLPRGVTRRVAVTPADKIPREGDHWGAWCSRELPKDPADTAGTKAPTEEPVPGPAPGGKMLRVGRLVRASFLPSRVTPSRSRTVPNSTWDKALEINLTLRFPCEPHMGFLSKLEVPGRERQREMGETFGLGFASGNPSRNRVRKAGVTLELAPEEEQRITSCRSGDYCKHVHPVAGAQLKTRRLAQLQDIWERPRLPRPALGGDLPVASSDRGFLIPLLIFFGQSIP